MIKPSQFRSCLLVLVVLGACADDSENRDDNELCPGDASGCSFGEAGTFGDAAGPNATPDGGAVSDGAVAPYTDAAATTDGGSGDASAEGGAPPGGGVDGSMCPPAPMGASTQAVSALTIVNGFRVPAGSGCIDMAAALNMSALNHCNYYAMNSANKSCVADVHSEVMSCTAFTGTSFGQRAKAAGYTGQPASEVMAFNDNPSSAIATWVNSVWHRIPILDPWTGEMGYGNATRCDTIDFGRGMPKAASDAVVVYPYDGQTALPTNFDGSREGPQPPAPASGWPSSSPITVYAKGIKVTEHVLTRDGDPTPIEHVFLDSASTLLDTGTRAFLQSSVFMYANKPFLPNTKYRVKVTGTRTGGVLNMEWTFTTGATNRF